MTVPTVRYTAGRHWARWSEPTEFEGDITMAIACKQIAPVFDRPFISPPDLVVEPGTIAWAGRIILEAARALGVVGGTFEWEGLPEIQRLPPGTVS